jgi:hypothetical protein
VPDDFDPTGFARTFMAFMQAMQALAAPPPSRLPAAIAAHLGTEVTGLPVVEQTFALSEHPNLQLALERIAEESGVAEVFGLPVEVLHWGGFGLANLASSGPNRPGFHPVAPAYVNVPVDVDRTLPCVSIGVWLLRHEQTPVVALTSLGDPHRGMVGVLKVEVMATEREVAVSFLAHLTATAHELNVYRGKVLSFAFGEHGQFGVTFHPLPELTRDDLILPEADLDAIEEHAIGISAAADRLRAAGRHVKRGLLLFGPPGTGKTFSVMYLCSRMPERTVVLLSGQAAPTLGQAAAIARSLQPSMLVLEDVDLVAMERTLPGMGSNPLLFQLLNEMDGLNEDADVIFVLTTNRVELLEPALAARPGRIDQAVEIRLPDSDCRRRLLYRYLRGLRIQDVDLDTLVEQTAGVSPAFLKELTRRAALEATRRLEPDLDLVVTGADLAHALDDLREHSTPILRTLLGLSAEHSVGL